MATITIGGKEFEVANDGERIAQEFTAYASAVIGDISRLEHQYDTHKVGNRDSALNWHSGAIAAPVRSYAKGIAAIAQLVLGEREQALVANITSAAVESFLGNIKDLELRAAVETKLVESLSKESGPTNNTDAGASESPVVQAGKLIAAAEARCAQGKH